MIKDLKELNCMTDASKSFIVKIAIFTFINIAISTTLFSTILKSLHFGFYIYQIIIIAIVTTFGHLWVLKATGQNTRKFTTAFMASVTFKLLIYLTFMLVYLLIDHSQVIIFVLSFFIFYITFTIFEVIQVLDFIKK